MSVFDDVEICCYIFISNSSKYFGLVSISSSIILMFQVIDQDENYTFEIFHKQDSIECANLLAKAFTTCNPYEIYMKTTYEQFYDDALALCQSIAYSELSIIARHKDTKEIDAIVQGVDVKTFNSDESESESESGLHDNCRRLDPIMPLLQESERRYLEYYERKFGELQENCVAHILMAGVRLSCIGRGKSAMIA